MSTAERLRREGRERGIVEGQARALRRLLTQKFGPLPDEIEQRIADASTEQLDRWGDRLLMAAALQDIFA